MESIQYLVLMFKCDLENRNRGQSTHERWQDRGLVKDRINWLLHHISSSIFLKISSDNSNNCCCYCRITSLALSLFPTLCLFRRQSSRRTGRAKVTEGGVKYRGGESESEGGLLEDAVWVYKYSVWSYPGQELNTKTSKICSLSRNGTLWLMSKESQTQGSSRKRTCPPLPHSSSILHPWKSLSNCQGGLQMGGEEHGVFFWQRHLLWVELSCTKLPCKATLCTLGSFPVCNEANQGKSLQSVPETRLVFSPPLH